MTLNLTHCYLDTPTSHLYAMNKCFNVLNSVVEFLNCFVFHFHAKHHYALKHLLSNLYQQKNEQKIDSCNIDTLRLYEFNWKQTETV